ncbi:hypothetical protein LJC64_01175 [Ruminococcaceae bacterium OttesenSCG-928-A11]|nr:hypothetical protein [Ruminococcaceae bacterium OttesenSCG-928-A11]
MEKFEGVALEPTISEILAAYSFGQMQRISNCMRDIYRARNEPDEDLRPLFMLALPGSAQCFRMWDVMREGTVENREWVSHMSQDEYMVAAYGVIPDITASDGLFGNIYALNYDKQVLRIMHDAVPMEAKVIHYSDGRDVRLTPDEAAAFEPTDDVTGFTSEYDEAKVRNAVQVEVINQDNGREGYWFDHTRVLRSQRIAFEAMRITRKIEGMKKPNSPSKTHYLIPAPDCLIHMNDQDRDAFFSLMPYRSYSYGQFQPDKGPYISVYGEEIQRERDEIRRANRQKGGGGAR